jgi:hypothetical protein
VTDRYPAGRSDKPLYEGMSLPLAKSTGHGSLLRQDRGVVALQMCLLPFRLSVERRTAVIAWNDRATEGSVAFGLGLS